MSAHTATWWEAYFCVPKRPLEQETLQLLQDQIPLALGTGKP